MENAIKRSHSRSASTKSEALVYAKADAATTQEPAVEALRLVYADLVEVI